MKGLFSFLFLLAFFSKSHSQDNANNVIHITKLLPGGIFLNKGWKFQGGDSGVYARPGYDDNKWQAINPADDINDLVSLRAEEIGWFRLHLNIDSQLLNKPLALKIQQIGASQFYLNGQLVLSLGRVSKDSKKEVLFNPNNNFYSFQWTGGRNQVLSVRYSFTAKNFYFNNQGLGNPCLAIQILPVQDAIQEMLHEKSYFSLLHFAKVGFLFLLFLIHFFFYFFYPERKTNLYYSFFALCLMFYVWLWYGAYKVPREGQSFFILNLLSLLTALPSLFLALTAVYSHAGQKKRFMYWFTFLCLLLAYPTARWPYQWGWLTSLFYALILALDAIRVSVIATKQKITGSAIILFGWIVFLFSTGFGLMVFYGFIKQEDLGPNGQYIEDFAYNAGFLFLYLPFSIILASQFAQTNRSLKQQLTEVGKLSQKTIEQEQEKQQILSSQKETLEQQVTQRTAELKQSLENLKATQTQLVQSEKMASLGELTAGIAHEIQNPLNFVNNFSEVNKELLAELKDEADKGNIEEVKVIANDVIDNEQKINHHGRRADAIVKGMLQHSQKSSGQKEPTDINALADEYLRLAFHGMRAKDKSFNATIDTRFDETIGKIEVVPQDIGRVLLNFFNNAFYAINEKKKQLDGTFEPVVSVTTERSGDKVQVRVKDNGVGIPQKAVDKIFQPFFTTKPTGQGTGLGLSLSYDIIKAHGGEIKVNSEEGKGAEFIIFIQNK